MSLPLNRVLLIAVDGELRPSRVTGEKGKKVLHTDTEGQERAVSAGRALWVSTTECATDEALNAYWSTIQTGAGAIDLPAAWRWLQEQEALGEHAPAELRQRMNAMRDDGVGATDAAAVDALVVAVFGERLHFRLRKGKVLAVTAEALETAIASRDAKIKEVRHLAIATERLGAKFRGESVTRATEDEAEAESNHLGWLAEVALHAKDSDHYRLSLDLLRGMDVAVDVPTQAATAVLRGLGTWSVHENIPMLRTGLPTHHREAIKADALKHAAQPMELSGRADYRSLLTVAIDDAHTYEVDDAFALDGHRVYVFIADAAAWVPLGSPLYEEAAQRVSTLYLPEQRWPMLPASLGEGEASLCQGEDRLALAYSFELSPDGEIEDFQVERAVIRVDQRLTYEQVDAVLGEESPATVGVMAPTEGSDAGASAPSTLSTEISDLVWSAAQAMEARAGFRERSGAMTFTRDEVYFQANPQTGDVVLEQANPNGAARQLIAEMMVTACGAVAQWCHERNIPTIYRSQAPPTEPIDPPDGPVTDPWQQWNILRRFKPSRTGVEPLPHYSLALPKYTQVSSPLRRFSDLVMNHQIAAAVRGEEPPFTAVQLQEMLAHIDRRSGDLRSVEQQSRRYWSLWFLETHPDVVLDGLVVHEVGRRWVIRVPQLALIVTHTPRNKLKRSQRIKLRVGDVSAARDRLVFIDAI